MPEHKVTDTTSPSWCHTGYLTDISLRPGTSRLETTSRPPCCLSASVWSRNLEPSFFDWLSLTLWWATQSFKKQTNKKVKTLLPFALCRPQWYGVTFHVCETGSSIRAPVMLTDGQTAADHQLDDHLTQTQVRSRGEIPERDFAFLSDAEKNRFSGNYIMTGFSVPF